MSKLVRISNCGSCDEAVEVTYTLQEFRDRLKKEFDVAPSFERMEKLLFGDFWCTRCAEGHYEPTKQELNQDYWKNYSISNPNE